MTKNRLEAFSDGVVAIIITIMVLEMKVPKGASWGDLKPMMPVFFSYVLSFVNVGIYWNNHHHMLHAVKRINGITLWANLHLLFWLSLIPFTTGWMGTNHFEKLPVALYGTILSMAAISYFLLSKSLIVLHGKNSTLSLALGKDRKGIISLVVYMAAVGIAFIQPMASLCMYAVVAVVWFIPDKRIEKKIDENEIQN